MSVRFTPRSAVALVLALGCAVSLGMNLPGHLSYDSILQLWQGRSGVYNTWHPPVMAWLLGLGDALVPGASLFVVLDTLLLYGALAALLLLPGRPSWLAIPVALLWAASPQGLIYPGIVWKDVLYAGATVCGFVVLAFAAARWHVAARARVGLSGAALALWTLAALARQNGLVALVCGVAALGWIAGRDMALARVRRGLAVAGGALLASLLVIAAATAAFNAHSDGEPARLHQVEDLQAYDLAAAVRTDPGFRMGLLARREPDLERLIRTHGAAEYSPVRIDSLAADQALQAATQDGPPELLAGQWRDLVLQHPGLYLKIRLTALRWVFLTPDVRTCVPIFVGVTGPQPWMDKLHIAERESRRDHALRVYSAPLMDSPIFSHAAFALAALALLAILLRRRAPADVAMVAMISSALLFAATFLVLSVACDYRYLYALDVSSVAGALYLALTRGWRPSAGRL